MAAAKQACFNCNPLAPIGAELHHPERRGSKHAASPAWALPAAPRRHLRGAVHRGRHRGIAAPHGAAQARHAELVSDAAVLMVHHQVAPVAAGTSTPDQHTRRQARPAAAAVAVGGGGLRGAPGPGMRCAQTSGAYYTSRSPERALWQRGQERHALRVHPCRHCACRSLIRTDGQLGPPSPAFLPACLTAACGS